MSDAALSVPEAPFDSALVTWVESRHGTVGYFSTDTSAVAGSLARYGEWAENEIAFMRRFIEAGGTVLDVGAFIGTHSLAFAHAVGPSGKVLAFEAQPRTAALLAANCRRNGAAQVEIRHAIVADFSGSMGVPTIDVDHAGSFGSATIRRGLVPGDETVVSDTGQDWETIVDVPVVTIDSLNLARCDLIKLDIEGTEYLALRGAAATIARHRPVVYAECNSVADGMRTAEVLREFGYCVRMHVVAAFNPDNIRHASENIFGAAREAALVGVPPEQAAIVDAIQPGPTELLATVATADDIVLCLLNKPQYPSEILERVNAASSGASAWLARLTADRADMEQLVRDRAWLQHALEQTRADLAAAGGAAAERINAAEVGRDNALALADAAMRQAGVARAAADAAEAHAASAERDAALAHETREQAIAAILASTSWRLTAPLRWLTNLLRGRL